MTELVRIERSGGVCEVRLDRPDKRNALTRAMYGSLSAALAQAERDADVRVVLLSGAGACFTAGNDLHDFLDAGPLTSDHPTVQFMQALARFGKVLIAAVHGRTVGIGVTLLLHCDLVMAARGAELCMPFVRLGLVPEAGSSLLLPRVVGLQRATELLLLGRPLAAEEACRLGIVNRVVEDHELVTAARALAAEAAGLPPQALRAAKRLLRREPENVAARIDAELEIFKARLGSDEFRTAIAQVLKRPRSES